MLNKSGESEHPCLIPNLRGKAVSLSPLITMLTVGVLQMLFNKVEEASYTSVYLSFYHKAVLKL